MVRFGLHNHVLLCALLQMIQERSSLTSVSLFVSVPRGTDSPITERCRDLQTKRGMKTVRLPPVVAGSASCNRQIIYQRISLWLYYTVRPVIAGIIQPFKSAVPFSE